MRKIAILLLVLSFFLFSCSKSNPSNSISSIPNTTGEQQPYQSSTQLNEENQTLPENSSDQSDYEEARRLAEERFKQQQTLAQSQFNNQLDATISQWEELSKDIEHLWEEQYRKSQEEFIKTQNLVRKIWGEAIFPTQKQWIEFSEDFKTFSNVNFDESGGFLQIKTIVDKDASDEEIKKNIDEQLKLIMNKIDPVTNKPILGDLVVVPPNLIVVDPPEKILQPIKLSNIDFRRISNNKIFWNKVEKASGYEINVYYNNNKVYSNITENIEYDLSAFLTNQSAGFYTVKIITIGNGIEYLNSDEYEIPQKLIKTQKLGTPSTIEWDTNVVRWNKIENTKEYKVKLFKNNSLLEEKTTTQENIDFSAIISKSGVGTFEVSVQAIGDGQIYLNSDEKRAEKTREIIKYLDQVKSPSWQRNTLVWEKVDSIREYNIKIFKDNQLIHQVTSRVENIDLDKIIQDNGVGSYYATVQAIGDGRFYRNGAESVNSSINIIRIKLPEVQNLTFKNMKASWRLVEKATGYELLLFKNQFLINTITLNKNTFEYDLTQLIETSGDGRYTVRIQTKGDGRFYTNSDVTDFSEIFTYITEEDPGIVKDGEINEDETYDPIYLASIQFRRISNNKIFWNKVEKASGYEINVYYNNNKVYSNITENIEYDLSAFLTNQSAGFYTVKIITIGNGIEYLNSDEYEIPQKLIKTQKLGTPSTIEWDTNVVRWNKIENTKEYKVKLFKNNSLLEEKTTTQENIDFSAIISKSGVGTFEVSVQAIGDGQIYLNSDEKRAEKTREIIKYLDQVKSPSWQRNTLVWEKVDSIREYNIKIFKDNQLIHQVTSRVENIDLDKIIQDNGVGSYYATVQAIGDGRFYRNGAESVNSSINIIRIKLPEVQNLTFKNMKASWRLVEKATGYELLLFKNQFLINTITLNKNTFEYDLTQLIETSGDGRYTVRIQTKGDGRFYTNSDVTDFSEFYDYKKVVEEKEDYDKVIYTLTIPLVDNFLETRVLSYKEIIEQYAEELNVSPEFIMAIIHTESSFNPNAVSGSGAVGLMQVIPKFGGAEGYYEIHGEMKVHEPDFFFDPETGVKYGTAYLKRLAERYFKEMTEETKRHFLVITSYNWGPTNIRNLARENQVENLTEMELYELLRDQTREETKNYIERVLTRQEMYKRTYYGDR